MIAQFYNIYSKNNITLIFRTILTANEFVNGSKLSCVVCSQVGTLGNCARSTQLTQCPTNARYCKSKVSYFISSSTAKTGNSFKAMFKLTESFCT